MDFHAKEHNWTPQPVAAGIVRNGLNRTLVQSPWISTFAQRLRDETGTRLVDWLDHIRIAPDAQFEEAGFVPAAEECQVCWLEHPGGIFPKLVIDDSDALTTPQLGIKVESIEDFLAAHTDLTPSHTVIGNAGAPLRMATLALPDGATLHLVERHGYRGFSLDQTELDFSELRQQALEQFRKRTRSYNDPAATFADATERFITLNQPQRISYLCDAFFQTEREFWQANNTAARIQYARQQKLGLGWANHDHHTYRCSRQWFAPLVAFLELVGFTCRERFYAGREAGWGAQVLEQPDCGLVIFADVDMSAEELLGDFSHEGLPAGSDPGTVGLWCQLHGDSFGTAGMHHLECQFDFVASQQQLAQAGIETMAPFTDFPHLKQAFTKGETWTIPEARLDALVSANVITSEDATRFLNRGAIGSHLEILERNDGFKGFNQTGISQIILETNPRTINT